MYGQEKLYCKDSIQAKIWRRGGSPNIWGKSILSKEQVRDEVKEVVWEGMQITTGLGGHDANFDFYS